MLHRLTAGRIEASSFELGSHIFWSELREQHYMARSRVRGSSRNPMQLDLHGYRVKEAEELLAEFLSDAIMAGSAQISIVHGLGSGKVKAAVHRYLSTCGVVKRFAVSMSNPGETIVYL